MEAELAVPTGAASSPSRAAGYGAETIRALVILAERTDRWQVERAVAEPPALEVVGFADYRDDWQELLKRPSDVVLVGCEEHSEEVAVIVDWAVKHRPGRPVVVMSESCRPGLLWQAFEAGADDVIALPREADDVRFALEKVLAHRRCLLPAGKAVAPLIGVLGPKGGTGKTLVAANLAVALAARDLKVVLVDLDLQFGDVGLSLGLSPDRTIYDLMRAGPPFDHEKLDRHLVSHASGVRVLIAPTRPDQAGAVSIDYLCDIYASLRAVSDVVIVDTPPGFPPEVIATIDVSTDVVMVGMLDALSLKNTKLALETLDLMAYDSDNVEFVLNRAASKVGITPDDVSVIVGRVPDVFVPSDRQIAQSINQGTPIVVAQARSKPAKAFSQLADRHMPRSSLTTPVAATPIAPAKSSGKRRLVHQRSK